MKIRLAVLLSLLASCASTAPVAAPTEPRPQTVHLEFDWSSGTEARVEAMRTATDVSPRGRFVDEARISYRLQVRGDGEGVRVVWDQASVEALPQRWIPRTVEMVAVEIGQADFRVSPVGSFLEVTEPSAAQARVASWATDALPGKTPPPGVHGRLADLFSEESISARMARFWGALVGYWNGGSLEIGRPYTARDEIRVAGLGGIPVHMDVEISARGWVSCGEGEGGAECIELELVARPAEDQRPLLHEFTTAFFASDPARELRIEHGVVVVTEPKGLRPRSMRALEVVEIPLAGGESILISDERSLRFRWAPSDAREPGVD